MKRFNDYLKVREAELPVDIHASVDQSDDGSHLSDDTFLKLCRVVWRKYKTEMKSFLDKLADKDSEIKRVMSGLSDDGPVLPHDRRDKDDVVLPTADGSPGLDSGEGDSG